MGRSAHATCCLGFGTEHPQLLMSGGIGDDWKTLKDCWLFDVSSRSWKEVRVWTVLCQIRYLKDMYILMLLHAYLISAASADIVG